MAHGDPSPPAPGGEHLQVDRQHHGCSLFDFLDALAGPLDRRAVLAAARRQQILLNAEPAGPSVTLRTGDVVDLALPLQQFLRAPPAALPVLHRGAGWLVTVKASGVPFDASGRSGPRDASTVMGRLHEEGAGRPRAVHRLDKDTSGVVVVALDGATEETLAAAFGEGRARVEYLALVRGAPREDGGQIDVPLGKRRRSDAALKPDPEHGTPCLTGWSVVERLRGFALLRLVPRGGRSHQVRAHLAAWGRPALCDRLYGEDDRLLLSQLKLGYRPKRGRPERPLLARPALHAERFVLDDLLVEAPLADDVEVTLAQLRRLRPLTGIDTLDLDD